MTLAYLLRKMGVLELIYECLGSLISDDFFVLESGFFIFPSHGPAEVGLKKRVMHLSFYLFEKQGKNGDPTWT